jgi:hypothetical protein
LIVDCARTRSLLHPWLDGELDRDDHRQVVEHLGACEQCDARFKDEQRLLARVKTGLGAPCPRELRARIAASIASVPSAAPRGSTASYGRFAAAAVVLVGVFLYSDPICLRGCPTVRALSQEFREPPAHVATCTSVLATEIWQKIQVKVDECGKCGTLKLVGWKNVQGCCKKGCIVTFKDCKDRTVCFVKLCDGHLHRWLQINADASGLIVTQQDGCRFAGWNDPDGSTCGFVCEQNVEPTELVALSEAVRR